MFILQAVQATVQAQTGTTAQVIEKQIHWSSNPSVSSWIQVAIYAITLIVLIRQVMIQSKAMGLQTKAVELQTETLKQAYYLKCQEDFTQAHRLLIQAKIHSTIYNDLQEHGKSKFESWSHYTDIQKIVYSYLEGIYELMERVFLLKLDGSIPQDEWNYWEAWIKDFCKHPLLRDIYSDNMGMYDQNFESYIIRLIDTERKHSSLQK